MKKIRVGILFGGKSAEHEVSLQSAKNVIDALDPEKYDPVLIGIDKEGHWLLNDNSTFLLNSHDPKLIRLNNASTHVAMVPQGDGKFVPVHSHTGSSSMMDKAIDVVFPILHGPCGEDGTIQGLLKLANIPFVGSGVLGSAVNMDKDVMKRLLRDASLPVVKFISCPTDQIPPFDAVVDKLGLPFFVKPANMGSSVGISKIKNREDYAGSVKLACKYDLKILFEEFIKGREIECAILGNGDPKASIPGEIIPTHEFYSYEAKYIDENGALLEIPAQLPPHLVKKVQVMAVDAFKALCCEGMARVDFFLQEDETLIVNEINTIPGFTSISMYPKLWNASGISYSELIDQLIQLAIDRFEKERRLQSTYN